MNEGEKVYKETNKLKSNTSVGIIPSNYAKSHRINSDLLHKTVLPIKSNQTIEVKCLNEEFTSDTSVIANASIKALESDDEYLEGEKKTTPKKKNRRNKTKESEVNSKDNTPPKTDTNVTTTVKTPEENVTETDGEPKPRIVLTFRSEKPGLRSSNMKIVSPDEKCHSEEANTRRSARFRTVNRSTEESDDSNKSKSPHKTTRKNLGAQSETDEEVETASPPPLKRSNRRRSKEFCENVLANAIARKEKSYNEGTPTQRLITRRIKPTAKVLANRELKLSVETTNSVRLGSEKSPEEGMKTRRSARKRTPETCTSGESSKSQPQKEKQAKKEKQKSAQDSDEETLKSHNEYVTVDDIKKCILGGSAPERKMSLKAESKKSHDRENRRFNKLKKKHLSKLGLQAVSGTKQNVSNSNENLTDDSTMDSTNTDAIVEHLNAQKKQLEQEKQLAFEEHEDTEVDVEELGECEEQDEEEDRDSELMLILNEDMENSFDEDEDFECRAKPDVAAVTPRVTRKSARLEQPDDSRHSDHSDAERAECSSPAGGDEGSTAMAPNGEPPGVAACLCTTYSNVYVTPGALTEPVFCCAVEMVNGTRVGCSHAAAHSADGEYAALRRPSVRVPYFLACSLHAAQLRRHLCCPACGVFCTQGTFYQCSEGHLFHLDCGVWMSARDSDGDAPGCPHCGENLREGVSLNRACYKVRVEMKCSNRQIFLPNQRLQCTPALMGFPDERPESSEREAIVPTAILPPAPVSLTSLRERGEATADYEELLTSSAEQRLSHAIAHVADSEHVLTKLISCVDLHQALDTIDGGTFMHLAAKHGNLTAVYLLHYAGCRLDAPDSQLRTPLVVAVLSLLEKQNANENAEKMKCKSPVGEDEIPGNVQEKNEKINPNTEKSVQSSKELAMKRKKGIMDVIRYMVGAGCDVNFQGAEGMTALHVAAQHGGRDACEALLESHRARIDARDLGGWTPLVWAAENKHVDVVRLLLRCGADASSCDGEGNSVVHWCALAGCSTALQLLLDAATPHAVDTVNPHGDTPLHVAARQDHYPCVVVLLARGGRTDMKNSSGELAVDCARAETRTAISLNMQMSLMARDRPPRHKLLSSDISRGREEMAVSCVNELDDTPLPSDFTYVTRHVQPQHVRLHTTLASMQGCDCSTEVCGGGGAGAGAGGTCACCVLGVRRWYSEGRLLDTFPFRESPMLFECNETCKCNLIQCPNAVITRLSKRGATFVRTQVFRCRDARGWGLRALTPVPRGTPVALYCGELLKASVADMRSKDQYMFAMEVKRDLLEQCEEKEQLCVDAGVYGSAARFINHSCGANLAPVRVFTHARDVRAPNIVLFATRNIQPLEELTFNYGDRFWSVKSKFMSCCCGAPHCRYPAKSPVADR